MKIVIVGAGEVGVNIAHRLVLEDKDVVVIDKDQDILNRLAESIDIKAVRGSGSSPLTLNHAGIKEAEVLLALADSDEVNFATCLITDMLSPSTKKLARIRSGSFIPYYETLRENTPHINTVINPDIEVVKIIESFIDTPGAVDILDFASGHIKFVGVRINSRSPLTGIRLANIASVVDGMRPLIVAVVRDKKLIIPSGKDILVSGDLAYFISEEKDLVEMMAVFDPAVYFKPVKRVLIIGGGTIGYHLAKRLETRSISCKIIEKKSDRCEHLASKLNRAIILHGDGSDQDLLREENISEIDVVVTLTKDEETNVLISLLAKHMGANKTITKVSKLSYSSLMSTIGIEQVVSSRLSAVNTILQHIRRGKILSAVSIRGEAGEVMEAVALPTSDVVSKPLKKMSFPKEAMVAGIIRDKTVIIPNGDSVISPGDRIIVFAKREAIPGVEKSLSVKLDYF